MRHFQIQAKYIRMFVMKMKKIIVGNLLMMIILRYRSSNSGRRFFENRVLKGGNPDAAYTFVKGTMISYGKRGRRG